MIYDTDIIDIISVTEDEKFGNQTTGTTPNVECRIEDTNEMVRNSKGESVKAKSLIMLSPDVSIKKIDRIILKKIKNVATGDSREYEILSVFPVGGFGPTHQEVMI